MSEPILTPPAADTAQPDAPTLPIRGTTAQEDALYAWFTEQQSKSVDNLEAAARQIIVLCTTLLGVLLALLSLAKEPLPTYLDLVTVRLVAGLGVLALFLALTAALAVVLPRATPVVLNDPDALHEAFARLLQRKEGALQAAVFFFGAAMLCLVLVIAAALFRAEPAGTELCRTTAAPWWCGIDDLIRQMMR